MCSITGNFSVAGIEFHWPSNFRNADSLEIRIEKPKAQSELTAKNLRECDKEWLTIESPSTWVFNLDKLRTRFRLESKEWLTGTYELTPDDEGSRFVIIFTR